MTAPDVGRRRPFKGVVAWVVAIFFAAVALAQDARQPGLRLLWAALALVWAVVGIRLLGARKASGSADEEGTGGADAP